MTSALEASTKSGETGHRYYPLQDHAEDCPEQDRGVCDWRAGHCHILHNSEWGIVNSAHSITVGTEEHGFLDGSDSDMAHLAAGDWHNLTCEPYEVHIALELKTWKNKNICRSATASV